MGAEIHENGAASNGHSRAHSQFVGGRQLIDRTEFVRVIQQSLHRLGYPQAAQSLQDESGVEMQPRHVSSFQNALHQGRWAESLELLPGLAPDVDTQQQARFCILRQKYIEAWEQGDVQMALHTLRAELAPLQINAAEVRMLSGLLLQAPDSPDRAGMDWAPLQPATRQALVVSLQRLLPPTLMVPDGRLEQLLEQALDAQIQACPYYNVPPATLSLLSNYQAGIEQLPTQQTQVLEGHSDEIWHVAFSHDGQHLGTASKDGSACLWAVKARGEALLSHTLPADSGPGPPKSLSFLAFSPDDSMLLTCGSAHEVRLWDVARGKLLREFKGPTQHTDQVTAVAWMPDGQSFLSSSLDRTVKRFSIDGTLQQTWRLQRINDMVLTPDGQALLYIAVDKKINVLRLKEDREVLTLTDGPAITSLAVAPGGAHLIAHMVAHTLQLWPLASITSRLQAIPPAESPARNAGEVVGMPTKPSMEYKVEGGRHGRFIIRSCFGGNNANFIASGSEDCRVHIWHRASGDLLARLEGHSGTVNSVAWNPTNPHMLASASDDKTVRIWLAPAAIERHS